MNHPFELTEDGKVRIVSAVIRDNALPRSCEQKLSAYWAVTMVKDPRSGNFYAAGIKLSQ